MNEAISVKASAMPEKGPRQWALTWAEATRELLTALGQWGPELEAPPSIQPKPRVLTTHEIHALATFFRKSVGVIRDGQIEARRRNDPMPPLPENHLFVRALLGALLNDIGAPQAL